MSVLVVGQRYSDRTEPWPEGIEFNFRGGSLELRIHVNDPTPREIEAVQAGVIQYALYTVADQIFFLYRFLFGDNPPGPWSDASYSWHRVPLDERTLPTTEPGHAPIHVLLLDARDGIIRAMRWHTLSERFTEALFTAIRWQAKLSYDAAAYEARVRQVQRWSTAELAARATIKCTGGS